VARQGPRVKKKKDLGKKGGNRVERTNEAIRSVKTDEGRGSAEGEKVIANSESAE